MVIKRYERTRSIHGQFYDGIPTLRTLGPSSDTDTLKALSTLPTIPTKIIDIGCGKGFSTRLLAKHTQAEIVAVDNEQSALDELGERLIEQG